MVLFSGDRSTCNVNQKDPKKHVNTINKYWELWANRWSDIRDYLEKHLCIKNQVLLDNNFMHTYDSIIEKRNQFAHQLPSQQVSKQDDKALKSQINTFIDESIELANILLSELNNLK